MFPRSNFHQNLTATKRILSQQKLPNTHTLDFTCFYAESSASSFQREPWPARPANSKDSISKFSGDGGDIWISRVKGRDLEASSSPPQMLLAFSSLVSVWRELLEVVQLLLNFELRDCCGCCTFGDLPSFSHEGGVWRQEKEKKKKKRENERKGGGLYCVL